jgi:hypothetical protein
MTNPNFSPSRPVHERFHRRHIRVSPPGQGLLCPSGPDGNAGPAPQKAQALPALRPVIEVPGPRPRTVPSRKRKSALPGAPRSLPALMRTVIAAVNARGICAAHAARLAELPVAEVDGIESLCQCAACLRQRAH